MNVRSDGSSVTDALRDFGSDPWKLELVDLDPELAAQDETIFALANGYLGLRGNHEEGSPLGSHGTFINGFHESWRIQHAEHAFGFAEHGQTIVNAPDVKTIRIYVDDERLNLSTAELLAYRRTLDMREGTLERHLIWRTPSGKRVRVDSRRMVSFASRHMATIDLSITLLDEDADVTVNSLVMNRQDLRRVHHASATRELIVDPRKSEDLTERVLEPGPVHQVGARSVVSYRVKNSRMVLGVGVDHWFDPGEEAPWRAWSETSNDRIRHVFQGHARAGQTIRLTKTAAYHTSQTATLPEMIDRCVQTIEAAAAESPEERWEAQRRFLETFWKHSDVIVEAKDPRIQQAIRWNLFQVAQASARADGLGIPAKGLTGSGYSGHYFWDSEIYVLPFLTYSMPGWARNALRCRERMLPQARIRAATLSEEGALFPWRTINGEEASAYYAAGTAAYHINADITYALARYVAATGDLDYLLRGAVDIVVETARLWNSLGFWGRERNGVREFHIHGVTGPDEYTAVVNDNLFTNVMARFNLRVAAEMVRRIQDEAPEAYRSLRKRLGLRDDEVGAWERAAEGMHIPYNEEMGVHPQDAHFLEKEVWDLAATPAEKKPLLLHYHPLVIYRFQVLKQADVVLALLLASGEFTREEKRRNFEYYDALTTGDSSLSAVVQSIIAAEVGYQRLAYQYFEHALHVDLGDLHGNTSDGAHIASAGGVWMMLVHGFAGMRDWNRTLSFDPRLPAGWNAIEFTLAFRGNRLCVRVEREAIEFRIVEGDGVFELLVRGEAVTVRPGDAVRVALHDQGPDLGEFQGLSAGMLPLKGVSDQDENLEPHILPPSPVPTLPPTADQEEGPIA